MDLRDQLQTTLGNAYSLEDELSGGGMARVFVARDHALDRKIVVKVLPPEMAAVVSVQRFKREIQVAARLQHPHIVPLLSAGETDGLPFYTMPFVKGESLRARLSRSGELTVKESLHILRDIASALAYAHGEGVIHRDIKPDNVIMSGGVAVVTDFGVAKAMDLAATEAGGPRTGITSLGVALGTPAYMSPEQASADPHVDHRADIYSFGCLAYELLAGASPFAGRPPQQMLAAHVTDHPDPLMRRRPTVPPALATLVMRCLEKRAGDRPQSATELLGELDAIGTPSGGTSPTDARMPATAPRRRGLWIAIPAAAIVILAVALVMLRRSAPKIYEIGTTTAVASSPAFEWHPAISPDGKFVAYAATAPAGSRVFVRQVDGGRAVLLAGDVAGEQDFPRWSPDGSRLVFTASSAVYTVAALGGPARRVASIGAPQFLANWFDAAWSPDGKSIAFATPNGIAIQALDGGAPTLVASGVATEGPLLHSPAWSPDGRFLAYVNGAPLVIGNVSTSVIWVKPLFVRATGRGGAIRVSDAEHTNESPVWAPDGRSLLFVSNMGGTLDVYQQPMTSAGEAWGAPVRLTTGLTPFSISLSRDGSRLAYDVIRLQSNVAMLTTSPARTVSLSAARNVTSENQVVELFSISHDGKWLAYDSNLRGNYDIYKIPIEGGEAVRLTSHPGNDFAPDWSLDDREIAFHSPRAGTRDIYLMNADGGNERAITSGPTQDFAPRFSPDGQRIAYVVQDTTWSVRLITRQSDGSWSAPIVDTRFRVSDWPLASWSPDGKLIATTSEGSAWVGPSSGGPRRRVVDRAVLGDSGLVAMWDKDPNVLYVSALTRSGALSIWSVSLATGARRKVAGGETGENYTGMFAMSRGRLYFNRAKLEGDVWVMELKRP